MVLEVALSTLQVGGSVILIDHQPSQNSLMRGINRYYCHGWMDGRMVGWLDET